MSPAPAQLLKALSAARASMPKLEKNDTGFAGSGYDGDDQIFHFPKEEDLRDAVAMVFTEHGLMEVIGDAVASAGFLATTWTLHHLESGESITHQITWPIDTERRLSRPQSAAAAWSHAWRHFMTKLLAVRTVNKAERRQMAVEFTANTSAAKRAPDELDRTVGQMPSWAETPPPPEPEASIPGDAPWRAQQRVSKERADRPVDTSPDAAWAAAGAVLEPEPAEVHQELFDVWAGLCADMRKAGCPKRWEFVIAAWHEFSGRTHDLLAPEDPAFKIWLKEQVGMWIRKNARPA